MHYNITVKMNTRVIISVGFYDTSVGYSLKVMITTKSVNVQDVDNYLGCVEWKAPCRPRSHALCTYVLMPYRAQKPE